MPRTLNYTFDLPDSFRPKAEYALRTLLRPHNIELNYVDLERLQEEGGLFYGLTPPTPSDLAAPVLSLISKPETWAFFAEQRPFDTTQIEGMELNRIPDNQFENGNPADRIRTRLKEWISKLGREPDYFQIPQKMPLLFGRPEVDTEGYLKTSEADLPASAFFLLSDWPQVYTDDSLRDKHHRILYAHTLQGQLKMGEFPLTDLYSEILIRWLNWCDQASQQQDGDETGTSRRPRSHGLALTFDIDNLRKHPASLLWRESRNLFTKAPNPPEYALDARSKTRRYSKALRQTVGLQNPFKASVSYLLEKMNSNKYPYTLFLKSLIKRDDHDARDYLSLNYIDKLIEQVEHAGSDIGFHASYQAGYQPELFEQELTRLRKRTGRQINLHRAHYLRYDAAEAPNWWKKSGIDIDSSLGWADHIGFRGSTTRPFRMYDVVRNRPTEVWQVPMNMMDGQLMRYMNLSVEEALAHTEMQLRLSSYFGGIVVWNFHHNVYDELDCPYWSELFEGALELIPKYDPQVDTLNQLVSQWAGTDGKISYE